MKSRVAGLFGFVFLASACVAPMADEGTGYSAEELASATGALIRMEMSSKVGVLLDEIPVGPLREAAAAQALAADTRFWVERAARQTKLTYYRLVFRGLYYPASWSGNAHTRGPLPLPPRQVWDLKLSGSPRRINLNGHDVVAVDYTFGTHILTDLDSPAKADPSLAKVGGATSESFSLPVDPELILQRTGYACMDEDEYPAGSVFEENTSYFYDDTCHVEAPGSSSCHITQFPKESCVEALYRHVGRIDTAMKFTRVAFDPTIAARVRVGTITNPDGADLAVVGEDIENEHRVMYKFFKPGSCELEEGVIGQLGWRRVLAFSATVRNDGTLPVHIGDVTDPSNPWVKSNVFEFSACHGHYHFSHYGNFFYAGAPGSKRAFCLEDTNRFHNDELTPLVVDHQSCHYQGITQGWGDEYEFGIPGQWVDITDVDASIPHDLIFESNPDQFLCEGKPVLDSSGLPVFEPTKFLTSAGLPVSRMSCDKPSNWYANNVQARSYAFPTGSFVTDPCTRGQIGPNRDCGFAQQPGLRSCVPGSTVRLCVPGSTVRLSCTANGTQVVRACEISEKLGVGVACTLADSSVNSIVSGTQVVSFTCPAVRDAADAGTGGFSLYSAPVLPSQTDTGVSCALITE